MSDQAVASDLGGFVVPFQEFLPALLGLGDPRCEQLLSLTLAWLASALEVSPEIQEATSDALAAPVLSAGRKTRRVDAALKQELVALAKPGALASSAQQAVRMLKRFKHISKALHPKSGRHFVRQELSKRLLGFSAPLRAHNVTV
eukprot:1261530-Lingulodinium_polyedra.AAC.1